jgi:hypothetical protein
MHTPTLALTQAVILSDLPAVLRTTLQAGAKDPAIVRTHFQLKYDQKWYAGFLAPLGMTTEVGTSPQDFGIKL